MARAQNVLQDSRKFRGEPRADKGCSDDAQTNCHARGLPLYGCTSVKAIATLASMESNVNPFMAASATYLVRSLPFSQSFRVCLGRSDVCDV